MEEMCSDEPFAVYRDGDEEGAKALTNQELMFRYEQLLSRSPIYVYISGNVSDEQIQKFIDKFDALKRESIISLPPIKVKKEVQEIRHIEEPMDVSQGQLCLDLEPRLKQDPMYYPLVI